MKLAVCGNNELVEELIGTAPGIEWIKTASKEELLVATDAAAYFLLDESPFIPESGKPVFAGMMLTTAHELNAPQNLLRINAWKGFLQKGQWEISGKMTEPVKHILQQLSKTPIACPDEPGFISPRIISLIVNEAYYALQEGVSTKEEIDIAMKLGTNYPYGPFEWSSIIGLKNINALLKKLSETDQRYLPAALLEKEAAL